MADRNQIPDRPIGFRLANELEGLLTGISSDGVITPDETVRLCRWMEENARFASVHPFTELDEHLTRVLADGILTTDECEDLLFVIRKYTRVNPHFDQLRGGIQILMGLLAGAAADSQLHHVEVRALSDWTEEWSHLRGLWPYDEISAIVAGMLARNRIGEDAAYLFDLARQFPIAGEGDQSSTSAPIPLLVRGVCPSCGAKTSPPGPAGERRVSICEAGGSRRNPSPRAAHAPDGKTPEALESG